ncbi:serine/threonine-protein kinase pim-3-like [Pimephales promelas]|nr:serine/threonine-protein kinase pim-3-like [Pimephales promelas]
MAHNHIGERGASGRSRSRRAASTQTAGQERLGSVDREPLPDPTTQAVSQELPGYLAPLSSVFAASVSTGKADRKRKRQSGSQRSQDDGRPSTAKRSRRASGRSRSSRAASTQTAGQERLGSDDRAQEPLPGPTTQTLSQKLPGYLAPLSSVFAVSVSTGKADRKRKRQSSNQRSQDDGHLSTAKRSRRGGYAKGPLLGRGGFGSVYAGIRRSDRLPVAIKYVPKNRTQRRLKVEGQGLLPLEVALMIRVNSAPTCPNVLQLVEWFESRSHYSMILERPVPCQDLQSFCKENGCVDESLAKKVLVQLITALRHCESRGVLHRDVKPGNLLISTASHDIKLLDFGCGGLLKDSAYTSFAG